MAVEVRCEEAGEAWYEALLEDVEQGDAGLLVRCSFEDDAWPERVVPVEDVRLPPARRSPREVATFDPSVGHLVELELPRRLSAPGGWLPVRVASRLQGIYGLSPASEGSRSRLHEQLAHRARLRPSWGGGGGLGARLRRAEVPLDPVLSQWLSSSDAFAALARLSRVAVASGTDCALHAADTPGELLRIRTRGGDAPALIAVGTSAAVARARALVPVAVRRALEAPPSRIWSAGPRREVEVVTETMPVPPRMMEWAAARWFGPASDLPKLDLRHWSLSRQTGMLVLMGSRKACSEAKAIFRAYLSYFDASQEHASIQQELKAKTEQEHGKKWRGRYRTKEGADVDGARACFRRGPRRRSGQGGGGGGGGGPFEEAA